MEVKKRITNYVESDFSYKGYRCVVIAQDLGFRCGYVGLPNTSIFYGKPYRDIPVDVHGDLTFAEYANHRNYPVETKDPLYWIGFDCAHSWDSGDKDIVRKISELNNDPELMKRIKMSSLYRDPYAAVRSMEYVRSEIMKLVDQIIRLEEEQ